MLPRVSRRITAHLRAGDPGDDDPSSHPTGGVREPGAREARHARRQDPGLAPDGRPRRAVADGAARPGRDRDPGPGDADDAVDRLESRRLGGCDAGRRRVRPDRDHETRDACGQPGQGERPARDPPATARVHVGNLMPQRIAPQTRALGYR
jgi:hypothetical protein